MYNDIMIRLLWASFHAHIIFWSLKPVKENRHLMLVSGFRIIVQVQ